MKNVVLALFITSFGFVSASAIAPNKDIKQPKSWARLLVESHIPSVTLVRVLQEIGEKGLTTYVFDKIKVH